MKIFGWLADVGACAFYRMILPLGALREQGHHTWWSNKMDEEAWEADVIIAQRTHLPGPTSRLVQIATSRANRPKLIYEIDDNLWRIDKTNKRAYEYHMIDNPWARENSVTAIKHCDAVTVTTEPLAEFIRQWNPNVFVLPNYIPADLLNWRHGGYDDRLTIGWQGSSTHDGDWLNAPAAALQRWWNKRKLRPDGVAVEMHLLGDRPASFPDIYPVRYTPGTPRMHDYYHSIHWDVALAPLADSEFNRSKSHLRALEASALGIPVVGSDVYAYQVVVEQGFGLLAATVHQWEDALSAMVHEPAMREEMSVKGIEYAVQNTIEDNAHRWLEAFK